MILTIGQSYQMTFAFFLSPVACVVVRELPANAGYAVRVPSGAIFAARWDDGLVVHA